MTDRDKLNEAIRRDREIERQRSQTKTVAAPSGHAAGDGSLDPLDGRRKRRDDCMNALTCLYIAVDKAIADDVNEKVRAYIRDLESEDSPIMAHQPPDELQKGNL